jgi:hypothetical protein
MRVLCRKPTRIKSKAGLDQPHGSNDLDVTRSGHRAKFAGIVGGFEVGHRRSCDKRTDEPTTH